MVVRLRGELDRAALTQAFAILCERHEAFRTTFVERDGVLLQRIQPAGELPLTWDRLPATAELAHIQAQVLAETQRLFDLGTGPLWRARCCSWASRTSCWWSPCTTSFPMVVR